MKPIFLFALSISLSFSMSCEKVVDKALTIHKELKIRAQIEGKLECSGFDFRAAMLDQGHDSDTADLMVDFFLVRDFFNEIKEDHIISAWIRQRNRDMRRWMLLLYFTLPKEKYAPFDFVKHAGKFAEKEKNQRLVEIREVQAALKGEKRASLIKKIQEFYIVTGTKNKGQSPTADQDE